MLVEACRAFNTILDTPEHIVHYLDFCDVLQCLRDEQVPGKDADGKDCVTDLFDAKTKCYIARLVLQAQEIRTTIDVTMRKQGHQALDWDDPADKQRLIALLIEHTYTFNKVSMVCSPSDAAVLCLITVRLVDYPDHLLEHTPEGLDRQSNFLAFLYGLVCIANDVRDSMATIKKIKALNFV